MMHMDVEYQQEITRKFVGLCMGQNAESTGKLTIKLIEGEYTDENKI